MAENSKPIPEERSLTAEERDLLRWLLEHGIPGCDSAPFLVQLE